MSVGYPTSNDESVQFLRIGDSVGRWTVIDGVVLRGLPDDPRRHPCLRCRCACGVERDVALKALMEGKSLSCGCLQRERTGDASRTHGESKTRLYGIWQGMITRCSNPEATGYENYGGRGVTVCDEWIASYLAFRSWAMANGYQKNLTIDRTDVNGNYEPINCRWVSQRDQFRNMRKSVYATAFGETMLAIDWSRDSRCKTTYHSLLGRIGNGWNHQEAITTPLQPVHKLTIEEARAVKADILAGLGDRAIVRKYRIGKTTARYIRIGKLWPEA